MGVRILAMYSGKHMTFHSKRPLKGRTKSSLFLIPSPCLSIFPILFPLLPFLSLIPPPAPHSEQA